MNSLNGFVTRIFLEKNGETVQTAIKVAELVITIRMARGKIETLKLFPGKEVRISYDHQAIEWF